jgi:predicted Ser/Thr protein kinase
MKKTISINIGGIIFHIEEDGYEKLKSYLSSIQKYFSSFADSKEIVSDIEGRIAERFFNKQKAENKQVISLSDVDELIAAMGTVADFEAIEQAEDILADPLESAPAQASPHNRKLLLLHLPLTALQNRAGNTVNHPEKTLQRLTQETFRRRCCWFGALLHH